MWNVTEEFGRNAGEVWNALKDYGPLTETRLKDTVRMGDDQFYSAVGWLARENKITKEGPVYRIGSTNLTDKIGHDAGRVYDELEQRRTIDVCETSTSLHMDERDVYMALGWLARENKVDARPTNVPREYQIHNT